MKETNVFQDIDRGYSTRELPQKKGGFFKKTIEKARGAASNYIKERKTQRSKERAAYKAAYSKARIKQAKRRGRERAKGPKFLRQVNVNRAGPSNYAQDQSYFLGGPTPKEKKSNIEKLMGL